MREIVHLITDWAVLVMEWEPWVSPVAQNGAAFRAVGVEVPDQ